MIGFDRSGVNGATVAAGAQLVVRPSMLQANRRVTAGFHRVANGLSGATPSGVIGHADDEWSILFSWRVRA
jgi:hypothetical protein